MRWLYRLQTRVGLTGPEGTAAAALLAVLLGGAVALHVQSRSAPLPADFYAAAADTAAPAAAPPALLGAPDGGPDDGPGGPALPGADSTAAQIAEAAVETAAAPRRSGKPPPAPTNINTASEAELQRLPRIGPALAARIVAHRRANGPFRSVDQITDVKGIGEKTLEQMRPWLRL